MSSNHLSTLEASLQGVATVERVPAERFAFVLDDHIDEPAVGAELPFEGVTLEGTRVSTSVSPSDLQAAATGVTPAGLGVADYGTVTVRSRASADELVALYPDRHVAVLAESDVVGDMPAAFDRLATEFEDGADSQVLTSGPSSTADLGALIEGVHGPSDVRVLVLEGR
jgi:L-lactate dehydrogenase complex protein LldG